MHLRKTIENRKKLSLENIISIIIFLIYGMDERNSNQKPER